MTVLQSERLQSERVVVGRRVDLRVGVVLAADLDLHPRDGRSGGEQNVDPRATAESRDVDVPAASLDRREDRLPQLSHRIGQEVVSAVDCQSVYDRHSVRLPPPTHAHRCDE